MTNPFDINRDFEKAICSYTGAPFAVTTNSCTMALFLALKWHFCKASAYYNPSREWPWISIPKRTYVSVPMQIKHAGFRLRFEDLAWNGAYKLKPLPIWDSARWFTGDLFNMFCTADGHDCDYKTVGATQRSFVCVSFHSTKTLGIKRPRYCDESGACSEAWDIEQGGAILHNDPEADKWFRRARFDGRTEGVEPKDDTFDMLAHHCYLNPSSARLGLKLLKDLPRHNAPLPNDDYPDLSQHPVFATG